MSHIINPGGSGSGGRTPVPSAGLNYYVATTGSDSNPGTLAQPWLTLAHADAFIAANLDFGGNLVTVNIGAGSFPGFISSSHVGGGNLQYQGAGPGSTIITPFIEFSFPVECIQIPNLDETITSMDGVTFQPKGEPAINCFVGGRFIWGNNLQLISNNAVDLSLAHGCTVFDVNDPGSLIILNANVNFPTPTQVTGAPSPPPNVWYGVFGGGVIENFENWNFVSSPTFGFAFAFLQAFALVAENNEVFTGTVTGPRVNIQGGSGIVGLAGALGDSYFPGSSFGSVDQSSFYDNFPFAQFISGAPTTSNLPDAGSWGLFDGGVGNVWIAYNQSGTIVKTQLPSGAGIIHDLLNNILVLTPSAWTLAYATDTGQFLLYDGSHWQLDSSYLLPKSTNFDMGAVQYSNLAGYGLDYVTNKLLANVVLGYGSVNPVENSSEAVEGQLVHDPHNFVTQIFQDGAWFTLATGNFRELASEEYALESDPLNNNVWIKVYAGNSELLGLNGLPLIQGYTASMGAYPVPLVASGGTF